MMHTFPVKHLPGGRVRLEPLTPDHAPGLLAALNHDGVWDYIPWPRPRTVEQTSAYIESALAAHRAGTEIPVAMIDAGTNQPVGTSRYTDISAKHRSLEVGWTMISPTHQRTSVNTEVKLMMLAFAFEDLRFDDAPTGCIRVQLKCDHRNTRSQNAILRIGAQFEGRLRKHRIMPDGFIRDTMMYAITDTQWPGVRSRLLHRLGH